MMTGAPGPPPEATSAEVARERLAPYLAELGRSGFQRHMVYVAAKLGLPDLLKDSPRASRELAAELGAHADTLHRVLRGMVGVGLVTETRDGRFALDAAGHLLRSDAPDGLRGWMIRYAELGLAWGGLLHAVRTGEPPFAHVFGEPAFARFAREPACHPHQFETSWESAQAVAASYDFAPFETVVDVGGGDGIVLAAILRRYPRLRGTVLDYPHQAARARRVAERVGVADRSRFVIGDFFEGVPAGDAYVLRKVLHDWDDTPAARILQRCRQAMSERGRVIAVEDLLPERAVGESHRGDVMMLVETGGRERTEAAYRTLFATAGLALTEIRPLRDGQPSSRRLIEGVPAGTARPGGQ
jgi:hypothetical protein